jgi:hypothetical protein
MIAWQQTSPGIRGRDQLDTTTRTDVAIVSGPPQPMV